MSVSIFVYVQASGFLLYSWSSKHSLLDELNTAKLNSISTVLTSYFVSNVLQLESLWTCFSPVLFRISVFFSLFSSSENNARMLSFQSKSHSLYNANLTNASIVLSAILRFKFNMVCNGNRQEHEIGMEEGLTLCATIHCSDFNRRLPH